MSFSLNKYFRVLITIIMVIVYLPLVNHRLPPIIGSIHLWFLIFVVSTLIRYPKIVTRKLFVIFAIYFLFMLLFRFLCWEGMGDWFLLNYFWEDAYALFQGIMIYLYFRESKDYVGWARIMVYTLLFMVITAIMTILFTIFVGGTERLGIFTDEVVMQQIKIWGSGSYSTMIVFMSLVALLMYYFKEDKLTTLCNKNIFIILVCLFVFTILRFQIFTNFIFAIVVFFLCFIETKQRLITMISIGVLVVLLCLIPKNTYVSVLIFLADFFRGYLDEISFKFDEFVELMTYGADSANKHNAVMGRFARFPILQEAFLDNPMLGYNSLSAKDVNSIELNEVYHLYWMCKLAACGLPMFLLNIYVLYYFLKEERKHLDFTYYYYFLIATLSLLLYGVPKVISGRETWIFFFVIAPGMYYLPLLNKKRNKKF